MSFKLETRNFLKCFDQCYEELYASLKNDGMLAVTFFETVRPDLILGKCSSVWKENEENTTNVYDLILCFFMFVLKNSCEVSFLSHRSIWGEMLLLIIISAAIRILSFFNCFCSSNFNILTKFKKDFAILQMSLLYLKISSTFTI